MRVQFTEEQVDIMQTALERWGLETQIDQTIEECAELIVALNKHVKREPKPDTLDAVMDEMADVEMMLAQMRLALGIDDSTFSKRIEEKFSRLNQYLHIKKTV